MAQSDIPGIVLFMMTEVIIGSIYIATPEGRLLDELNGRIISWPENRDKFLQIANVTIWHMDGTEEKTSLVYINKETIQMAGTNSSNSARGIGAKPPPRPYPFTEKIPIPARIAVSSYQINGNIYRLSHQKVEHVLMEKTAFLPMTDVDIFSFTNNKRWFVPFLAVNKDQILSIHE